MPPPNSSSATTTSAARAPTSRYGNSPGGNQQKVLPAREVAREPAVLVVSQPTRGLDIGAIEYVHGQLRALRDRGCAVLLVSTELDEILELSDRVAVLYGGRVMSVTDRADVRLDELGLHMAGRPAGETTPSDPTATPGPTTPPDRTAPSDPTAGRR